MDSLPTLSVRIPHDLNTYLYAVAENTILQKVSHPFIVKLHYSFQNESKLNFVMDYCPGGELFTHLKKRGKFGEPMTQFYAAEVILALDYLHEKLGIIYR